MLHLGRAWLKTAHGDLLHSYGNAQTREAHRVIQRHLRYSQFTMHLRESSKQGTPSYAPVHTSTVAAAPLRLHFAPQGAISFQVESFLRDPASVG